MPVSFTPCEKASGRLAIVVALAAGTGPSIRAAALPAKAAAIRAARADKGKGRSDTESFQYVRSSPGDFMSAQRKCLTLRKIRIGEGVAITVEG